MDIALAIDALIPGANYFGSVTSNLKEDFDKLIWNDSRTKPTWTALTSAYESLSNEIKNPSKP